MAFAFKCPICGEKTFKMSTMYWHLKTQHDMEQEEAYSTAGDSECIEED